MKPSQQIRDFIMQFEGFGPVAYRPLPTDRWTIGYGSTYFSDGNPVEEGETISKVDAAVLFNNTLDGLAERLSNITPPSVTQQQFDAVLSLAYNIGFRMFATSETGTLYKQGKNISFKFGKWNQSGGKVQKGLVNRRSKEQQIYDSGIYS